MGCSMTLRTGADHQVEGVLDLGHAACLVGGAEVGQQHLHFAHVLAGSDCDLESER